tara:strand:+ start:360 stop:503 length:144 start_codon:yes stop_codon:yes gene_type:complete
LNPFVVADQSRIDDSGSSRVLELTSHAGPLLTLAVKNGQNIGWQGIE